METHVAGFYFFHFGKVIKLNVVATSAMAQWPAPLADARMVTAKQSSVFSFFFCLLLYRGPMQTGRGRGRGAQCTTMLCRATGQSNSHNLLLPLSK